MSKRYIALARVSSKDQADFGTSLESQTAEAVAYIERMGGVCVARLAEDVSGTVPLLERETGRQAHELLTSGAADGVVMWRADRFSRDLRNAINDAHTWLIAGYEIFFIDKGQLRDYRDIAFLIDAWKSNEEHRAITERTHQGRKRSVMNGKPATFGIVAYGFTVNRTLDGAHVKTERVVNEAEARVIRRARDLVLGRGCEPMAVNNVCRLFDSERIPIPAIERRKRSPKFNFWHGPTLARILRSPATAGHFIYSGIEVYKPELAILSDADQIELDRRIRANKPESKGNRRKDYLMAKRLKCSCGRGMSGATFNLQDVERRYYRCTQTGIAKSARTCTERFLNVNAVDSEAWRWVCELVTDMDQLIKAVRARNSRVTESDQPRRERIAELAGKIEAEELRIKRFHDRLGDVEDADVQGIKANLAECRTNIRTWALERDKLAGMAEAVQKVDEAAIVAMAQAYSALIVDADFTTKRYVIEHLDVRGQLEREGDNRYVRFTCGLLADDTVAINNQSTHG